MRFTIALILLLTAAVAQADYLAESYSGTYRGIGERNQPCTVLISAHSNGTHMNVRIGNVSGSFLEENAGFDDDTGSFRITSDNGMLTMGFQVSEDIADLSIVNLRVSGQVAECGNLQLL